MIHKITLATAEATLRDIDADDNDNFDTTATDFASDNIFLLSSTLLLEMPLLKYTKISDVTVIYT